MVRFVDGELVGEMPAGTVLYHVDHPSSGIPGHVKKVDWAWREPRRHLLCELKDPECAGALIHNNAAAAQMRAELAGVDFPNALAEKAHQTAVHHQQTAQRKLRTYIVMAAISTLSVAEMGTAALVIQRSLQGMGTSMPVIVVNIAEWNQQLAPRTMQRVP